MTFFEITKISENYNQQAPVCTIDLLSKQRQSWDKLKQLTNKSSLGKLLTTILIIDLFLSVIYQEENAFLWFQLLKC